MSIISILFFIVLYYIIIFKYLFLLLESTKGAIPLFVVDVALCFANDSFLNIDIYDVCVTVVAFSNKHTERYVIFCISSRYCRHVDMDIKSFVCIDYTLHSFNGN